MTGNHSVFSLPYSEIRNFNGNLKVVSNDWYKYTASGLISRTLMTVNTTYNPRQTLGFSNLETMMMIFTVLRVSDDWLESKMPWELSQVAATECAVYFCANAYQTKSQNSVPEEDVVGSWAIRDPSSHAINHVDDRDSQKPSQDAWNAAEGSKLYDPVIDFPRYDLRLVIPTEQSKAFPSTMVREFNVSHTLIRSTIQYLDEITHRDDIVTQMEYDYASPVAYPDINSPAFIDALWNSTNLTATFENVAKSLAKQIRNTSPHQQEGVVLT
ncbi:hypothetical protein EJ02DRAFT_151884 [Clathrospora elynae]|uniref:Uncharacterized protein n=1 Tax=Clathrospora elynae TaxID=706981 RepID=A0A6A5SQT9_9PLEO|nr:hypothetical protein EJ02DRAFT_151884 [Clathrospora elynae]